MKKLLFLLLLLNTMASVQAQSAEDSVKAVINNLFKAMKSSDAILLKSVFTDSAILQTIGKNKEGETVVKTQALTSFIESIGQLPIGAADEQISFDLIKIDAALAVAWTPYQFFFNGKFSHCGVNSFQLVKINNGWKIQYLIDTRRKTDCK